MDVVVNMAIRELGLGTRHYPIAQFSSFRFLRKGEDRV
jgi:hypothetical protein